VVEEVDVGLDRDGPAVERQVQVDPRLLRLAPDVRGARSGLRLILRQAQDDIVSAQGCAAPVL
jgi:hypothetical protein